MSLGQILSVAQTGLAASQSALGAVSNNVANVNTAGYARTAVAFESLASGGAGAGVAIADLRRVTDRFLEITATATRGDAGHADVRATFLGRLQALIGDPASSGGLAARLDGVVTAAINLSADAADPLWRRGFIENAGAALSSIQQLSADITVLRSEANTDITASVARVNTLLGRIDDLNRAVVATSVRGGNDAALGSQRAQALEELSGLLRIDVREQPNGAMHVALAGGQALIDGQLRQLTTAGGAIGLALVNPQDGSRTAVPAAITSSSLGGRIGGLMQLRDAELPAMQDEIATLFKALATTINRESNAGTAVPPPASLTGRNTGLLGTDRHGFSGQAVFAVTDRSGQLIARTTLDFASFPVTASIDDVVAAINNGLGGVASAQFADGRLSLTAIAAGHGVVVADDPLSPSDRTGAGFSAFFGLNDLFVTDSHGLVAPGFTVHDPHGFSATQTAQFELRDESGRILAATTLTPAAGTRFADLLAALQASPLGSYGSFSLDAGGRLAFTPMAGRSLNLSTVSDTTQRGGTGVTLSQLWGVGAGSGAALVASASVNRAMEADPRRLGLARLDLAAVPGDRALSLGDQRGAAALLDALDRAADLGAYGAMPVSRYAAQMLGRFGVAAGAASDAAADRKARADEVEQRLKDATGVNLDEEMSQMIVFQNSYAASARLITTAREMYDILLQLGN